MAGSAKRPWWSELPKTAVDELRDAARVRLALGPRQVRGERARARDPAVAGVEQHVLLLAAPGLEARRRARPALSDHGARERRQAVAAERVDRNRSRVVGSLREPGVEAARPCEDRLQEGLRFRRAVARLRSVRSPAEALPGGGLEQVVLERPAARVDERRGSPAAAAAGRSTASGSPPTPRASCATGRPVRPGSRVARGCCPRWGLRSRGRCAVRRARPTSRAPSDRAPRSP